MQVERVLPTVMLGPTDVCFLRKWREMQQGCPKRCGAVRRQAARNLPCRQPGRILRREWCVFAEGEGKADHSDPCADKPALVLLDEFWEVSDGAPFCLRA